MRGRRSGRSGGGGFVDVKEEEEGRYQGNVGSVESRNGSQM